MLSDGGVCAPGKAGVLGTAGCGDTGSGGGDEGGGGVCPGATGAFCRRDAVVTIGRMMPGTRPAPGAGAGNGDVLAGAESGAGSGAVLAGVSSTVDGGAVLTGASFAGVGGNVLAGADGVESGSADVTASAISFVGA